MRMMRIMVQRVESIKNWNALFKLEVERVQHKDACCWLFPLRCMPWKGIMWIFQKTCIHFLITQLDQQPCSVHGTWYTPNVWTVYHVHETGTHQSRKDLACTWWRRASEDKCPPFLGISLSYSSHFAPFPLSLGITITFSHQLLWSLAFITCGYHC